MLRVRLLGGFEVENDQGLIPADSWRRRRPADLLKIVASSPGGAIARDALIDRLWPEKGGELGANNLHRALHDLRQVVGAAIVVSDKGVLRLASDAWSDVLAFEAEIARNDDAALHYALDLYRADLCPEDSSAEWLASRRIELRKKYVDAALKLSIRAIGERRDLVAIDLLRKLLEIEPSEEEAHRLLMRALVAAGRRHDALQQFERLKQALRNALDEEPSEESRSLYEKISRGELEPRASRATGWARLSRRLLGTVDPPPIRGRRAILETIDRLLAERSGVLLLMGESGSGKTRLLVEASRRVGGGSARLLAGSATEAGLTAPFAPFQEAFFEHAREHGASSGENPFSTFEPTPGGAMEKDKLRLFRSIERTIETLAGSGPVLLAIDDLQWADESSLHLFHHLARATREVPFFLAATTREEEIVAGGPLHTLLTTLKRERLAVRIHVERLGREETREQIADLLGRAPDPEMVAQVFSLGNGNPFFTEELTRSIEESGAVLAEDVLETVRARIERLGPEVAQLLGAASVIGTEIPFRWVQKASDLDEPAALRSLEVALRGRQLEESEAGYRFRHTLVREVLYGSLTAARREHLHRAVAAAIEAEPESLRSAHVAQLAHHHLAGDQLDRALPCLVAAGQAAAKRAGTREAVAFFERAIGAMDRLGIRSSPQRFSLLLASGQMQFALADLESAVARLDQAAALEPNPEGWRPSPAERARALRSASLALITAGDLDGADRRLEEAEAALPSGDPELSPVLYITAQLRWHQERHRDAYVLAERALIEAERQQDPTTIGKAYEMLALACHSLGEWKEGLEFVEKRKEVVGSALDVAQVFDVHL
jgi:DNA-binding SARP family transcriptional activator